MRTVHVLGGLVARARPSPIGDGHDDEMPDFKRLLGAAAKALGDSSSQSRPGSSGHQGGRPQGSSGTDWRDLVRTAADRLTGDDRDPRQPSGPSHGRPPQHDRPQHGGTAGARPGRAAAAGGTDASGLSHADRTALAKYDYLVQTARPDQLEQVHREAFARLTPEQRAQVRARLTEELPAHEQPRDAGGDELARAATRGEVARPGLLRRVLGGHGDRARGGSRAGGAGRVAAGAAAGLGVGALGGLAVAVAGGAALSAAAAPLLGDALASGLDFDGIADGLVEGVGADGLLGDLTGLGDGLGDLGGQVEGLADAGGEQLSSFGDQVGDLGQGFELPRLGDLFDR